MSVVELLALSGQVQPGQRLGHDSIALGHKRRVSLRSPTSGQSEGSSCVNTRVHVVREREIAGTRESTEEFGSVRDAIDWMAHTRGEAVFLVSPETGRVLTFAGLREKSRAISTRLRRAGLDRGDKVAFLMDNGLFTAQLFLGTMYAGLVSVPLNVRGGASQLSYMLDHCDAKVVFVSGEYDAMIKEAMTDVRGTLEIICADLDSWAEVNEAPSTPDTLPSLLAEDAALLMYSSGTTGRPNGAIHTHKSILAHGRNSVCSHQLTAADRSLLVLPLYHINAECVTLIPTLVSGGSVVIPRGFVVSEFWNWLDDYRCTWSALVPTIISQLLDWKDPKAESRAAAFQRIRFLRTSSAPLSPALHREFLDKFKLPLIQAMGSSEAGNVFSNPVPPGVNKIGSPGLPWGFDIKVIGRDGEELPAGEAGEVLIRGKGMMRGYHRDPERTATALDAEGWLHTGDLAYRDQDGYFFIVGRSKELIIKGGMNIAPKQIDEILESHPAVLEAAAVGVPDRYVGEDVVAFAVLREGMRCDEGELLSFCESHLGHFKTPTRIHFVPDLPKGPSGKVQRLKLQEEAAERSVYPAETGPEDRSSSIDGPRTPQIEQIVGAAWAKLLKQPHVDAHSNFFLLGGHSLLAIQCLSLLREELPIRLSLADFFENATVAEQAALIRTRLALAGARSTEEQDLSRKAGQPAVYQPIPPRDRSLPCPLSPNQRRIWFMEQVVGGEPVYNEAEAVRLRGELNVEALEDALNAVVARHENLRTTIRVIVDEPRAFVHDGWRLKLKTIDLSTRSSAEAEAEVKRLLIDEPRIPYRLEAEPGVHVSLLRLGPTEHVLILMMHHIICDWTSIGNFWRDLSASYRAGCRGQPFELPGLPIQHGDYAVWQQKQLSRGDLDDDLAYWAERLRDAPALMDLPGDRPRPPMFSYRGAKRRFRIEATLSETLKDLGRCEKVSLFTLFTSALNALLYRYTGQEDILVGIPLADRDRPELETVVGFLLHTHVLRTQLAKDLTFRELMIRVQKSVLDLYAHSSPPFDQVVTRTQPERNPSYSPLFQVLFIWRDGEHQPSMIGLERLGAEPLLAESGTAKFDLTVFVTDGPDGFDLDIEYCTDLFDEARIERMAGHICALLEAVAANPDKRVSDLPMLTAAERQKLLVEWNRTAADYPKDRCVHELFEQQVEFTPDAIAVEFDGKRLTYRELNERANRLARHLQGLGVGPGALVAISVERSLEMMVGLLGVLKSGGAYMPLDPTYPADRLEFMLRDSGALLVLSQQRLRDQLEAVSANVQILCLDGDQGTTPAPPTGNRRTGAGSDDLAYVIYTSGSTGQPKGVEITHRNLTNVLCAMAKDPGFARGDKLLAVTTISFDIAALELFLPLIAGGQVEVAPGSELPDGFALRRRLGQSGATVMQATPATWAMLIEAGWSGDRNLRVLCGGEAVPPALADALLMRAKEVLNVYGPTETTIWSSVERLRAGRPITIGSPIANTQYYVVDRSSHLLPVGVPGELLIGGDGVARGYLHRPELTAEKFIADQFRSDPGARLYKTGDLVRRLSTGAVEFLGRLDQQVKIRGFRIELGEIESVLAAHPAVRAAVALVREDVPSDKRLVAYVTLREGEPPRDSELREQLRAKLPEYMTPQAFVVLDHFPMTPSGKVDRKALPRPDLQPPNPDEFIPPSTVIEQALASIWGEVLGLDRVGVSDNFFEIGGHSLLAARVIRKVNRTFHTELNVGALFLAPSIATLASAIEESKSRDGKGAQVYTFRNGHIGPPLYFLGAGPVEHRLTELIGNDHTIFAVDLPLTAEWSQAVKSGNSSALPTFDDLGARFGDIVRTHSGSTPCVLAGYSFYGKVAFEAARTLLGAGGKVAYVLLIDAYATRVFYGGWRNVTRGAVHAIGESRNLGTAVRTTGRLLRWLLSRRAPYFSANESSRILLSSPRPPRGSPVSGLHRRILDESVQQEWVEDEWMRSVAPVIAGTFNPRPLDARGVLIRTRIAGEESLPSQHLTNGWRNLFAQGLEVIKAPGGHVSMVRDPANRLEVARAIKSTLEQHGMADRS